MHLLILAAIVLVSGAVAGAQTPGSSRSRAPDVAMRAFIDAMNADRWTEAARYIDTTSFASWLREQIAVTQRSGRSSSREALIAQFAGRPSVDSLRRLSVTSAAALWLRASDPRWVTTRTIAEMRKQGCLFDSTSLAELMASIRPDSQYVAGVIQRDTLAYVVTQQILRDPAEYGRGTDDAALPPRVTRMRRSPTGWVIIDWEQWSSGRGQFIFSGPCRKKAR